MNTRSFSLALALFIALTTLGGAVVRADGFRCEGQGFHVKLFNQVRPELGTRNPAVLVFSQERRGTLAVFRAPNEIRKRLGPTTVTFQGLTHHPLSGEVVAMKLELERVADQISGQPLHRGSVEFVAGPSHSSAIPVLCTHYRKWPPELW